MRHLLLVALLLSGCSNKFDPTSWVNGLRLLGVKAEPPEVAAGQQSHLTALVAHPSGSAPSITWDACLLPPPPRSSGAVNEDCIDLEQGPALLPFGSGPETTATMPMVQPLDLGLPDESNGFYLPVRLRLTADGQTLTAFYRLRLYLGPQSPNPPNQNPVLMGVYRRASPDDQQGVPLDESSPFVVHEGDEVTIAALVTPESSESYVVYDGDPRTTPPRTVTETIRYSWFATAGKFSQEVSGVPKPNTTLTLKEHLPPVGSTIDLWVVARDDRGGEDWLHRTLLFQ